MRFLVDAQLPPALARFLKMEGYEAEHVVDCGLGAASDDTIWHHAVLIGAIIVTKDADPSRRKTLSDEGPRIVWVRLPNTRRRDLIIWFCSVLPGLIEGLRRGEALIEIVGPTA